MAEVVLRLPSQHVVKTDGSLDRGDGIQNFLATVVVDAIKDADIWIEEGGCGGAFLLAGSL